MSADHDSHHVDRSPFSQPFSRPSRPSRRQLLRHAGGLALAAASVPALSACTGSGTPGAQTAADGDEGGPAAGGTVTIGWWDHFRPLTNLFENDLFKPYMKEHKKVTVERRQLDGPELAQALQLGRRSNQLPDVHSIAGLSETPAALVANGWFQPIDEFVDVTATPVADYLYDGIHRFDGKVYTFPLFSGRWHASTPWLNTALATQAGVDPDEPAATWDSYRQALNQLTKKTADGVYGLLLPMQDPAYLQGLLAALAMTSGAPGGVDWRTGEYVWDSEPFLAAMDYLLALNGDGVLHPGSASMDPRDARARWAAGQGAIYMWGPWVIGGLLVDEPEAVERGIAAWRVPAPGAQRNPVYTEPAQGPFWVSSQSQNPDVAADLMLHMTSEDFYAKLATAMDQPPVLLDQVAKSDVHPAYKQNVSYLTEDVRIAPVPQVGNPDVAQVLTTMKDVHPDPGEIVQAVLTGATSNYRAALTEYNDKITAERDKAIKTVKDKGGEVSIDDWVFDNWDPTGDYTQQSYG